MERVLKRGEHGMVLVLLLLLLPLHAAEGAEIRVSGISEPYRDVTLSAPTQGTIAAIRVVEGQTVKLGQVLIELEKTAEALEVDRRRLILEDLSEVEVAAEQVKTLKMAYDSTRRLFESTGSVSKEDVAAKELEYKQALAEEARLAAAEKRQAVDLQLAENELREKSIRANFDGHVVTLFLDEGEGCKGQDPLIRLVDTSRFYFEANVEARHGSGLKLNEAVTVEFGRGTEVRRVAGRLSFVSPVVDPGSGLLRVKALCENADAGIKPGLDGHLVLTAR